VELDRGLIEVPLHHVQVELVPGHRAAFYVTANAPGRVVEGIFVSVKDISARDRWLLLALAGMGVQVKGWHVAPGCVCQEMKRCLSCAGTLRRVRLLS